MPYLYLLKSNSCSEKSYIGKTTDLRARLKEHNSGKSRHTSKFISWRIVCAVYFMDEMMAEAFEKYLKSGSGHAFAKRHLWPKRSPRPNLLEMIFDDQIEEIVHSFSK